MEFNEKLQELRKAKGLTQEELAEALYVSRAAVSKWESGRGYPSIDSLKEISKYFSITIDELICAEEIIIAAKDERKNTLRKVTAFVCSLMDVFIVVLLFIPVFGNGSESDAAVSLFMMTGIRRWIKNLFFVLVMLTVLNGICGAIISGMDKPVWSRHRVATGIALMVICSAVFILTRQPYAGIICFSMLIVKGMFVDLKYSVVIGAVLYAFLFLLLYALKKRKKLSLKYIAELALCIYGVFLMRLVGIFSLQFSSISRIAGNDNPVF